MVDKPKNSGPPVEPDAVIGVPEMRQNPTDTYNEHRAQNARRHHPAETMPLSWPELSAKWNAH